MHVSRPRVVGEGLVRYYEVVDERNAGIRSTVEIYSVVDPTYSSPEYYAFLIDDVPGWAAALPLEFIVDRFSRTGRLDAAIKSGLRRIGIKPVGDDFEVARRIMLRWLNYYGAWTPLLLMPDVTDIYVTVNGVSIQHSDLGLVNVVIGWEDQEYTVKDLLGRKRVVKSSFNYTEALDYLIRRISLRTQTPITAYNPVSSVVDPEFGVRFSVEAPPVSRGGVSVRVLPRQPWTLVELIDRGMVGVDDAALLWFLAEHRVPILIIGPMGGGKTSLQNAIVFQLVNSTLALIMDVTELFLPYHRVVIPMLERVAYAHGIRSITKEELIAQALRSGADIIVLNEARTAGEFKALVEAITLGHGAITTFHAEDVDAARARLREKGVGDVDILLSELAVVVEVSRVTSTALNRDTGVYEVKTHRFVRAVRNAERHIKELANVYGESYVKDQLGLRRAFLEKALSLRPTPKQLADLLRVFYRDPQLILKWQLPSPEAVELAQQRLDLPEDVKALDNEASPS